MVSSLTEHVLERAGCPLHYWTGGLPGRPLVVFTHGLCVDHRSWDPVWPVVAQSYQVLVWDVRGHGLSQPVGTPFTVPLAVEDLKEILDRLGFPKATFVGHSNGTYIAQELAFRCPERIQALVIADGTCITWEHTPFEAWATRAAPRMMALFPYETLKKASLPSASRKKEVQEYVYAAFSMLSRESFLALNQGMVDCLHAEPGYRITQPILLVHGDDDRMGDIARIAPKWAAREANCRYEVIPNARHFSILDNPEYFNRLLMEFLGKWVPVA